MVTKWIQEFFFTRFLHVVLFFLMRFDWNDSNFYNLSELSAVNQQYFTILSLCVSLSLLIQDSFIVIVDVNFLFHLGNSLSPYKHTHTVLRDINVYTGNLLMRLRLNANCVFTTF